MIGCYRAVSFCTSFAKHLSVSDCGRYIPKSYFFLRFKCSNSLILQGEKECEESSWKCHVICKLFQWLCLLLDYWFVYNMGVQYCVIGHFCYFSYNVIRSVICFCVPPCNKACYVCQHFTFSANKKKNFTVLSVQFLW